MKRLTNLLGAVLLLIALPSHATLQVFACEPEWASLTKELAGDKVTVFSATTAHQDVHRIQARPSLIARVRKADLLVCSGAELEVGWLPLLLRRAANSNVQPNKPGYFMAAEQVERLDMHASVDRSMGDVHAAGNPHIHLDPNRIASVAKALTMRLIKLDADNSAYYQQRSDNFLSRWQQAITQWQQQAAPLKGVPVVVHHKDWRYLLNWLEMTTIASLEPKPGIPPNANHLARLTQKMQQSPAMMILRAGYQDARPSQWLSDRTDIPTVVLPYTVGGNDNATDLFALYDDTLQRLLSALQ